MKRRCKCQKVKAKLRIDTFISCKISAKRHTTTFEVFHNSTALNLLEFKKILILDKIN